MILLTFFPSSVISPSEIDTREGRVALPFLLAGLFSVEAEGALSKTGAGLLGLGGNAYIDLYCEDL